jgi:uncharacterized membrane protein YcaP (DUF421 family)
MLVLATPIFEVALRTSVVYLALYLGLRLAGKRELGQMTVFDFVLLLLIANAVQNAMVGADTSLAGGLVAAAILLLLNRLVAWLRLRSPGLRELLEGLPTILVSHGELMAANLRQEGLDEAQVKTALREHGIRDLGEVELAVLEIDGSISVVPKSEATRRIKHPLRAMRH